MMGNRCINLCKGCINLDDDRRSCDYCVNLNLFQDKQAEMWLELEDCMGGPINDDVPIEIAKAVAKFKYSVGR